jgi:pimeloyl-ACP methyl ester carboxylesterase
LGTDALEMARGHASLGDRESRAAFIQTLRASLDPGGQRVRATDRLYLATQLPLLIVWGARDRIIPVSHGQQAHEAVPGSRFEVFKGSGHFLHLDEPDRFVAVLEDWIDTTAPADLDGEHFRTVVKAGHG